MKMFIRDMKNESEISIKGDCDYSQTLLFSKIFL